MGDSKYGCLSFVAGILLVLLVLTEGVNVGITYVRSSAAKGAGNDVKVRLFNVCGVVLSTPAVLCAVCLDGSPPAYHLDRGSGTGINNWLIHFEGGGWCNNVTTCLARRDTRLGSSKHMETKLAFSGILSNIQKFNPDFYNWNRIKARYCDGASFTGDVEGVNPATKLHFRGARSFRAIIEDLLGKGMNRARNAILSGCSAGGLTAILNCDKFRGLLPRSANVKCLADAGFFINVKDVSGNQHIQAFYAEVVATHGSTKNLLASCTSRMKPSLCFFPQNAAQHLQTPLFVLNAAYDAWQIKNILAPGVADQHGTWHNCKTDIRKCSANQIKIMQDFRLQFINATNGLGRSAAGGMFIDSCYAHCQSELQETWLRDDSPILGKTTISKAVGDWCYGRHDFRVIDCAYPCNPTCHNRIYES